MNKDKHSNITYNEFVECSKQDPTVMDVRPIYHRPCNLPHVLTPSQALSLYDGLV